MIHTLFKIPGHNGDYMINCYGDVWSNISNKYLKLWMDDKGYLKVKLRGGKPRLVRIHSLVLRTFKGNRPKGLEGCHNDGEKLNNHISNLRWDTHKNNMQDATKHGAFKHRKKTGGRN